MAHLATSSGRIPKAVIFDMGGVVLPSPTLFLRNYAKKMGLPPGFIAYDSEDSAWAQWERGEISMKDFARKFGEECSKLVGKQLDLSDFPFELEKELEHYSEPYPEIIEATHRLRMAGIKTALLTNNFCLSNGPVLPIDQTLYDQVVQSAIVHMRKPHPSIYLHTLELLNIHPEDAVFLDDLEVNVKAAQKLGMRTIKVNSPAQAISDLEKEVGIELTMKPMP